MSVLETPRILLRRWKTGDLEPFHRINSDAQVMQYFPSILSREQTMDLVTKIETGFEKHGFGLWAAELKTTGEMIGFIGLSVPTFEAPFTPCVEIGWRLAKAHWGRGLAPEGAKRALDYAFREKGLAEILSWTSKINFPSRRVMEKIGMVYDPRDDFEHPLRPMAPRLRPHVLYRIKKENFLRI